MGEVAEALNIGEPEPVPGCKHEFDRIAMKFCPECGKAAYKDPDSYSWVREQAERILSSHGLGLHDYDESGIYIGSYPGGKGQAFIDSATKINQKCVELFGREASMHEGEYPC